MKFLTKRLMEDIKLGGIVIAPRRSGKTTAIQELMKDDETIVLSCHSSAYAKQLGYQFEIAGVPNAKERVIGPDLEAENGS